MPNRTLEWILMAAGERIVAFARPGKHPEIPVLGANRLALPAWRAFRAFMAPQRILKPGGIGIGAQE